MSDPYAFDPSNFLLNEQRGATSAAMTSLGDDPEKAARAQELSEATGTHPAIVYGDLENFETQHKASLTAQLLQSNRYLGEYVNSHPLASKISNDDYGQLDAVSQHVQKLFGGTMLGSNRVTNSVLAKAFEGFKDNFDMESLTKEAREFTDLLGPMAATLPGAMAEGAAGSLALGGRLVGGVIGGAMSGLGESYKQLGGSEAWGNRLVRDSIIIAQMALSGQSAFHLHPELQALAQKAGEVHTVIKPYLDAGVEPPVGVHPIIDEVKKQQAKNDVATLDQAFKEAQGSNTRERSPEIFASFIRQHTDAKIGISADAVRKLYGDKLPAAEDGKLGWQADLADQLATAEASGGDVEVPLADWLAKVDPEVAKELHDSIRVRPGGVTVEEGKALSAKDEVEEVERIASAAIKVDGTIYTGIHHGEAALKAEDALGKPIESSIESDLTGFVTNTGRYVSREEAEVIAKNADQIVKHREGRLLLSEDMKKGELQKGVDAIRKSTALQSLFEHDNRKLVLNRYGGKADKDVSFHDFTLNDEKGDPKATLHLSEQSDGKGLMVEDIRGLAGFGPRDFGPSLMRGILRQIKQMFPNAEWLEGYRVSGARDKANTWESHGKVRINLQALDESQLAGFEQLMDENGTWLDYGLGTKALVKPRAAYTENEAAIAAAVDKELKRIVPKQVTVESAHAIRKNGGAPRGTHIMNSDQQPIIIWSLESEDAVGTARHEAMHHLRQQGFWTNEEWSGLMSAAIDGDWLEKHNINKRYPKLGTSAKIEEAIADEFKHWNREQGEKGVIRKALDKVVGEKAVDTAFRKLKDLLDSVREAIGKILGKEPTFEDLFNKADRGEIGSREGNAPRVAGAHRFDEQLELPDMTRMEDREAFAKANAIGMTVKQYRRYMELIEQRRAEDAEAIQAKAVEAQRKRQTKEWKDAEVGVRAEVAKDLNNRPDMAADRLLSDGVLFGDKLATRPKLSSEALSDEQKAGLPKEYLSKDGIHPDDLAGLFGYSSGRGLVDRLVALNAERAKAGMKPEEYRRRLISIETERQMEKQFGDLGENILAEAKDQVLSETQIDLLHEETMALAMQAGAEFSITKGDLKDWIKGQFDKTRIGSIKTDKFLAAAGKAGRLAETSLLEEKPGDAFRAKQQQYIAITMAQEAKKLEKSRAQFDKLAKRMSAREVPTMEPEYTNFVHDILGRVGKPVRRSVQDLEAAIARGEQKTLADFVDYKEGHDMREVPVAEFLLDPNFRKEFDNLTAEEFRAVNDSVKTLVKNGRDERKINKAGEEADLAEVKTKMIEELQQFKERHYDAEGKRWLGPIPPRVARPLRTFLVSHLQLESLFNRWDRGDPRGVFTQTIARELATAANYEAALERKYSKLLAGIADKAHLKEGVENDLFRDPLSRTEDNPDGELLKFNRKNLRAILQNAGNESNLTKLSRGYGVKPEDIMAWLNKWATKEDWDWAQAQGDIFAEINKEAGVMYRGLSGVEPESIPIKPISTAQGTYPGWYHPVVYHPVWEGTSKKLMGGDALEQDNYIRATTPRGYTKQRTAYSAPLSLDLDQTPVRMKQMIHDIAFRPAVINAGKVFYAQDVRAAIAKHYGVEYRNLLIPYLRDVANSANYRSDAALVGTKVSEFVRQNVIATLIGLNPGTVMKHGPTAAINSLTEVGPMNFLRAVKGLLTVNDATGENNWQFAMKTSEELQRRHRHYNETLGGAQQKIQGEESFRDWMIKFGAYPVAISDLLSAVPTWMAQYEKSMREGADHGEAVFMGDRAVRRAHGSSVVTNRPALMRGGAMASWMTSLYGFFNHILNRQYELMWKAGDTLGLVKEGEYKEAVKNTPQLMAGLFSYILFPAMIEEMVTPLSNDQHESWGKKAAKAVGFTLGSSWTGIRDIVSAVMYGRDPSAGLLTTAAKTGTDVFRDLNRGKQAFDKAHAGQLLQHGFTAFGALTGLTNATEGRAARFIYNYSTGLEKPKGFSDWFKGLRHGTMKEQKR